MSIICVVGGSAEFYIALEFLLCDSRRSHSDNVQSVSCCTKTSQRDEKKISHRQQQNWVILCELAADKHKKKEQATFTDIGTSWNEYKKKYNIKERERERETSIKRNEKLVKLL